MSDTFDAAQRAAVEAIAEGASKEEALDAAAEAADEAMDRREAETELQATPPTEDLDTEAAWEHTRDALSDLDVALFHADKGDGPTDEEVEAIREELRAALDALGGGDR